MRARRLFPLAIATALCLVIPAQAEVSQQGNLVTSFEGSLSPTRLPRQKPVPVAVRVAGDFKTAKGAQLPQLRRISVAINRAGRLYDKGLPICHVETIEPATEAEAQRLCHRSIVGSGHVTVQVHIEHQASFAVKASLLAFNGPTEHGRKLILAQVYAKDPPGAFVLTFRLKKAPGLFGTVMSTSLPASAQGWAYLSHFDMTLDRQYRYRGAARSYVSAACGAPPGFPGAVFPLAKASYGFANGQTLKTTVVRSCRVSGG
jgi:hypothetical protein